jgi:hypothetical protein
MQRYYTRWRRKCTFCINKQKEGYLDGYLLGNCLLKHVTEVIIEGEKRRGRIHKQLPDDCKEKRRNWNLKEEALDFTL